MNPFLLALVAMMLSVSVLGSSAMACGDGDDKLSNNTPILALDHDDDHDDHDGHGHNHDDDHDDDHGHGH